MKRQISLKKIKNFKRGHQKEFNNIYKKAQLTQREARDSLGI